jgi:hypothetical protein
VELRSERPIIRDIAGVDAEFRRHQDASPSPHIPTGATVDYAVGQDVSASAEITAVTIREDNLVEALLGGEYVVKYHIPCGSDGVRHPGVCAIFVTNRNWGALSLCVVVSPKTRQQPWCVAPST